MKQTILIKEEGVLVHIESYKGNLKINNIKEMNYEEYLITYGKVLTKVERFKEYDMFIFSYQYVDNDIPEQRNKRYTTKDMLKQFIIKEITQ